jgi:hypothetical protein
VPAFSRLQAAIDEGRTDSLIFFLFMKSLVGPR